MAHQLAREIAEASRVLDTELPYRTVKRNTTGNVLVDAAKRVQRLQTKARRLRRELKATLADLKAEQRIMKALIREISAGKE